MEFSSAFFPLSFRFFSTSASTPHIPIVVEQKIESFYKRPLPEHLIPFSSSKGKKLFKEALEKGILESYWPLAEQFHTQSEPAYCGLATLAMVLNALQIDPQRVWKGPWRWFSEDLLDCCVPLELVKKQGVTLLEFGCLAKCHGADVKCIRYEDSTEESFREHLKSTISQEGSFFVVSFSRQMLGQTGDGHFAAISGYHPEEDLVLVMDTAKFKYPAFWCPVSQLYKAMAPLDAVTGHSRGYFILTKQSETAVCKLTSGTKYNWPLISKYLTQKLPLLLQEKQPSTPRQAIEFILQNFPAQVVSLISLEEDSNLKNLLEQVQMTELYHVVKETMMSLADNGRKLEMSPEMATVLFLACPSQLFKHLPASRRAEFKALRDVDHLPETVSKELVQLRYEMLNLTRECGDGGCNICRERDDIKNKLVK